VKGENTMLVVLGATVVGALALLFRATRGGSTEISVEGLSGPTPVLTGVGPQLDDMNQSLDEMLDGSAELLRECGETTALAEAVLDPANRRVVALPPWRLQRLAGIPAPLVVDARRLRKLPAADIRHALHRAYAGNLQPAKRLHAQLRLRAERAVAPLRESAVGALEDMYVLHPNADFGDDVIDA